MTTREAVDGFLTQQTLAIVGVSRGGRKFGNALYKELKGKGLDVLPVHPSATAIQGDPCYPALAALPRPAGGVVVVVPPPRAEEVVREAYAAGIRHVWLQQGAESEAAVAFCREHDMSVVAGECLLMFAQPKGLHSFHRFVRKLFGKLPA